MPFVFPRLVVAEVHLLFGGNYYRLGLFEIDTVYKKILSFRRLGKMIAANTESQMKIVCDSVVGRPVAFSEKQKRWVTIGLPDGVIFYE